MRRPFIVGNWKMNGGRGSSKELLRCLVHGAASIENVDIGVCIPYVFIPEAAKLLVNSRILLGSQNVADQESGAFTGEISGPMLVEFGCKLAIVGHSERRALYGESSELVADRYRQAIASGLVPILCVGETLEQREQGKTFDVVDAQLSPVLELAGVASLNNAVIAYEPVWAIGTGKTATTDQAQNVHAMIRDRVASLDESIAANLRVLYGGSVKPDNAASLFAMPDIDGGLIGGAALDADSFLSICNAI